MTPNLDPVCRPLARAFPPIRHGSGRRENGESTVEGDESRQTTVCIVRDPRSARRTCACTYTCVYITITLLLFSLSGHYLPSLFVPSLSPLRRRGDSTIFVTMEVTAVVARVSPPLFISLARFPSSFARSSLPTFFCSALSPSPFLLPPPPRRPRCRRRRRPFVPSVYSAQIEQRHVVLLPAGERRREEEEEVAEDDQVACSYANIGWRRSSCGSRLFPAARARKPNVHRDPRPSGFRGFTSGSTATRRPRYHSPLRDFFSKYPTLLR